MSDKKISGSLTVTSGENKAQIPDVPRQILEALYSTVTNIKDTISQKRRLPSIVKIDDLEQLVHQLDQWSKPFDPVARNVRVSVNTRSADEQDNGIKRTQYKSFEELRRELPGKTDQVVSVVLSFEFLARNEGDGVVNQCELTLEIKGRIRRIFYSISNVNLLGGGEYGSDSSTANVNIGYSDVIVARGLLNVVDEWYKSLPQRHFPRLGQLRLLLHGSERYERYDLVETLYKFSPPLFGIAAAGFFGPRLKPYSGNLPDLPFWGFFIAAFALVFYLLFGAALRRFNTLEEGYLVPLIEMTVGDQRRLEAFERRIFESERKLDFWGRTVAVGFAVGVLASLAVLFLS